MFLESWFLLGTLSAGIPVLIHLLARRESLRVEWPTLRFLEETERRTARRRRIEQLLLLLLRAAMMALLAIGLARPVIRYTGGRGADATVLAVLDDSLSSRAIEEGENVFERARSAAVQVFEGLGDNALCGILRVSGASTVAESGLAAGTSSARDALRSAAPTHMRGSTGAALSRALALAKSQGSARQEVYYLGDLQANAWPLAGEVAERAPNAALVLVSCAARGAQNLTLQSLSLRLAAPAVGSEVTAEAEIVSHATMALKTICTLFLDGVKRSAQELEVAPAGRARVAFSLPIESSGLHEIALETGEDALFADNRRYAAFFVPERIRVLLAVQEGEEEQSHFVRCGLDPFTAAGSSGALAIENIAALPADCLDAAAIFAIGKVLAGEIVRLQAYLASGGTLVVLPSRQGYPGWLPEVSGVRPGPEAKLTEARIAFHREMLLLAPFCGLSGLGVGAFSAVDVRKTMPLDTADAKDVKPVLSTTDGQALLLLKETAAGGRLYIFATGAGPAWGNLVLRGLFPLMLQQMVYQSGTAGGVRSLSTGVGESAVLALAAAAVDVTAPSGRIVRHSVAGGAPAGVVRLGRLEEPGLYRLTRSDGGALAGYIVSNPPALEGDLRAMPADEATRRLERAAGKCLLVENISGLAGALQAVRKGVPIFNYILGLVAAIVVFETFFANRIAPSGRRASK